MPFPSEPSEASESKRYPASVEMILKAQAEGAQAVHLGTAVGGSPYVTQHTEQGRFLALMWLRGYRCEQDRLRHDDATG